MKFFTSALSLLLLSSGCTLLTRGKCGDEVIDQNLDEECDDGVGNGNNKNCDQNCRIEPRCGDERLNGADACDDGNTQDDDGCSADCLTIEPGFVCPIPGEPCEVACGNGDLDPGEECEPEQDNCKADCQFVCDTNDECDDEDACTTNVCNLQTHLCEFDPLEDINDGDDCTLDGCDPANGTITNTPQNLTPCSFKEGPGVCTNGACIPSDCGDGVFDPNLEECDDNNATNEDGCTALCKIGPVCQDGSFGVFGSNATTDPDTGNCYIKINPPFDPNWFNAEIDCNNRGGGTLASIESSAIQTLVAGVAGGDAVWIGLTDDDSRSQEGILVWSDNTQFFFDNFAAGEPNDSNGEDCVEMDTSALWNDDDCFDTSPYICEFK